MKLIRLCLYLYRQSFLFFLPNVRKIISNHVQYTSLPRVQQKLMFSGKGKVFIGKDCNFGFKLGGFNYGGSIEIQAREKDSVIKLGNNISFNNNVFICATEFIEIKNNVLIGNNVSIVDFEAHGVMPNNRRNSITRGPVIIGENVWIGSNVIILKNTKIGQDSMVAAGAVVSGDFPENSLIGGVPAKVIKRLVQ